MTTSMFRFGRFAGGSRMAASVVALAFVIATRPSAVFAAPGSMPEVKALAGWTVPAAGISEEPAVEAVPPVVPEEPPAATMQDVLLKACADRGYGEDCAKTLLGMVWKESSGRATAVGDGGRARGYFQIHYKLHKVSVECAEDLRCSADWTLDYLERNGYPHHALYAVQCHNGCDRDNGYAESALRKGRYHWSRPMPVADAVIRVRRETKKLAVLVDETHEPESASSVLPHF